MREAMLPVIGICICAAFCEQLMDKNRYYRVVRMALGLQIAGIMIKTIADIVKIASN